MAFKAHTKIEGLEDLLNYILSNVDEVEEESHSWEEHKRMVEEKESASSATGSLTLVEKAELIVDDTLDRLINGEIQIETGQELYATVKAIAALEDLKCQS